MGPHDRFRESVRSLDASMVALARRTVARIAGKFDREDTPNTDPVHWHYDRAEMYSVVSAAVYRGLVSGGQVGDDVVWLLSASLAVGRESGAVERERVPGTREVEPESFSAAVRILEATRAKFAAENTPNTNVREWHYCRAELYAAALGAAWRALAIEWGEEHELVQLIREALRTGRDELAAGVPGAVR